MPLLGGQLLLPNLSLCICPISQADAPGAPAVLPGSPPRLRTPSERKAFSPSYNPPARGWFFAHIRHPPNGWMDASLTLDPAGRKQASHPSTTVHGNCIVGIEPPVFKGVQHRWGEQKSSGDRAMACQTTAGEGGALSTSRWPTHTYTCACARAHTHTHTHTYPPTHTPTMHAHTHTHTDTHTRARAHTHTYTCTQTPPPLNTLCQCTELLRFLRPL